MASARRASRNPGLARPRPLIHTEAMNDHDDPAQTPTDAQASDSPVGADFHPMDPVAVARAFREGAQANLGSRFRKGSAAHLPARGHLLMSGDIHDNALHYRKLLKLARLDDGEDRHLILHEVIHGPHRVNGMDLSVRLLAEIAHLKARYPEQVHLMMGNHELAQLNNEGILKVGANVIEAFDEGLDFIYGDQADEVRTAMRGFLRSLLLAVRCENGVMCAHSLPGKRQLAQSFDPAVLDRLVNDEDLVGQGSARSLVWGRKHDDELAQTLADAWGVRVFVLGHQPADMGYDTEGDHIVIINSDHEHGMALPIELDQSYDQDALVDALLPLAAVIA